MKLSSIQLEAFLMVVREESFSKAALRLHLTQSALSQRVINLEEQLELTLFLRSSRGVTLTEEGEKLLRYYQLLEQFESEYLGDLLPRHHNDKEGGEDGESGIVRIGGFSTFVRSLLIPKLGPFIRKNPLVQIQVLTREVRELSDLLKSGKADFIFSLKREEKQDIHSELIGYEQNVLITSTSKETRKDIFLDHDEFDTTTEEFFRHQKSAPKKYKRAYFDEIYTIIEAVQEGFGQAVVPLHLILKNKLVSQVKGYTPLKIPIYLCYFKQSYYTRLQKALIEELSFKIVFRPSH